MEIKNQILRLRLDISKLEGVKVGGGICAAVPPGEYILARGQLDRRVRQRNGLLSSRKVRHVQSGLFQHLIRHGNTVHRRHRDCAGRIQLVQRDIDAVVHAVEYALRQILAVCRHPETHAARRVLFI